MSSIFAPSKLVPLDGERLLTKSGMHGPDLSSVQDGVTVPIAKFLVTNIEQNYRRNGLVVLPNGDIGDIVNGSTRQ